MSDCRDLKVKRTWYYRLCEDVRSESSDIELITEKDQALLLEILGKNWKNLVFQLSGKELTDIFFEKNPKAPDSRILGWYIK